MNTNKAIQFPAAPEVQSGARLQMAKGADAQRLAVVTRLLAEASRPVLVAGYGVCVAGAEAELLLLAQRLQNLRVVATPRAKGVFPEDHPAYLGVIGFAGHARARDALFDASDWVLVVGTRLGEMTSDNWDPRWQQVNIIRVDVCPQSAPNARTTHVELLGDARALLASICHELPQQRTTVLRVLPAFDAVQQSGSLGPAGVMATLNLAFPDQCHIYCGIGNTMAWAVNGLRRTVANRWHLNLNSGAMGHAIPAAIGAALLGAPTLAILGDAEFLMTGFELHTAVENELPVIVVVLNDEGHGMVRIGSRAHCASVAPEVEFTRPVNLVDAARAMGASASRVQSADALSDDLSRALCRRGPTLIEVPISKDQAPPLGARLASLSQAFGIQSGQLETKEHFDA